MNTDIRRTTGLKRSTTALGAAVLVLASLALGACSKTDATGTASSAIGAAVEPGAAPAGQAAADGDTIDLVSATLETPATTDGARASGDRKGLRAKLLRALHASWVTDGASGPVTHQAVRGEVTAVSPTSITVKAKDGFSLTYSVTKDTVVRERAKGHGSASSIGGVKVGAKALVAGVGATNPAARVVVFRSTTATPAASPTPSATS
ncbi:hypothetical protein GCM10027039_26790 [Terrabacter koreensis]|jgi:hypothetical protein